MIAAHAGLPVETFTDPPPTVFTGIGSEQEFIDNQIVPSVIGQTLQRAIISLVREGYLAQVVYREAPGIPHGVVLDQFPARDDIARVGSTVVIEIGRPPPKPGEEDEPADEDDPADVVLATLSDYYNLIEGPPPADLTPQDEAVG